MELRDPTLPQKKERSSRGKGRGTNIFSVTYNTFLGKMLSDGGEENEIV